MNRLAIALGGGIALAFVAVATHPAPAQDAMARPAERQGTAPTALFAADATDMRAVRRR